MFGSNVLTFGRAGELDYSGIEINLIMASFIFILF
jgi:hypothetical protein